MRLAEYSKTRRFFLTINNNFRSVMFTYWVISSKCISRWKPNKFSWMPFVNRIWFCANLWIEKCAKTFIVRESWRLMGYSVCLLQSLITGNLKPWSSVVHALQSWDMFISRVLFSVLTFIFLFPSKLHAVRIHLFWSLFAKFIIFILGAACDSRTCWINKFEAICLMQVVNHPRSDGCTHGNK